ncbi:MAG: UDP-N-acetylmuramoyl-L-alanine--D-glutamate ligase [Bacteroidaceae bacterium]|nr:UDP-N-acetylmuramoyl-L-alanine--D-glutamate ligase [Bacteroidaceae bacterium]
MKKIVVLGAGESGAGAAVLAKTRGFDVFVSDMSAVKDRYKELLDKHGIRWEEKRHTEELILSADEIIKSPGIPDKAPIVRKAVEKGIHIISEIEFAGRYTDAKMICITGSNGKTTTTSLIYHILCKAGMNVGLAGNIGRSLALQVATEHHDVYVIELSSFQLDNMYEFKADIAVLMNITPDHLDRYDFRMQNYVDSKMRITRNQTPADTFIYWAGDPIVSREVTAHDSELLAVRHGFTADTPLPGGMAKESLSLKGRHNLYNSLAAGYAAEAAGVPMEVIHEGLSDFPGVEHRLEKAGFVGDVEFVNDSKATNVDACWYALESMTKPTVLILGGLDKGNDYSQIYELVRQKCIGLVLMGVDNSKLHENFDSFGIPMADVRSMPDCLTECMRMSRPGCCVLLSPCCASFDLFRNMEDRGEQFKEGVRKLRIQLDN